MSTTFTEGLSIDVPNEGWLQDKIDYAKEKSPTRHGHPYMGATTAYVRPPVRVPLSILKKLRGMRNEQSNVRKEDLIAIMRIMKDTGKLPLTDRGEEYVPFINVAYDGSAWINEGNHRIMAAVALNWDELPVEISYFDGGERVESGPMYPGKIGLGTPRTESFTSLELAIMEGGHALDEPNRVKEFISAMYDKYSVWPMDNKQRAIVWGSGEDQQFAVFELKPSLSKKNAVEVAWFAAYPLRQGVGTRAMAELQQQAREYGVGLTLFPWDKGQVSQSKLIKFYKQSGFKPTQKGGKAMAWENINEGGWASTATQNTVITPRTVVEIMEALKTFESSFNTWQAKQELDVEIKIGGPKGSGTYYRRDLEQDPEREYGDVDVECFIHSRASVSSAQRITEYRTAITEYCSQSPDYSTENGTNIIMKTSSGAVQVDMLYTFHEHANWSRALSPEYRVKGVISTSLTSSLAEVLNLSFSSQGIQVKIRNNQPVSFRQSKDVELRTVSTTPETWAQDIYSLYYYLANGEKPTEFPGGLKAHGGLKDEQRLSDIVLSIKSLANAMDESGLLGHGSLISIHDKKDMIRKVAGVYSKKLETAENSSKFDKAQTPAAVEKAKKTKLMLAKYRNEITKLLLN